LNNLTHQTVEKLQKKHGSSEDPSLVNNVEVLGFVYEGLKKHRNQDFSLVFHSQWLIMQYTDMAPLLVS